MVFGIPIYYLLQINVEIRYVHLVDNLKIFVSHLTETKRNKPKLSISKHVDSHARTFPVTFQCL